MKLPISRWTVGAALVALVLAGVELAREKADEHDSANGLAPVVHEHRGTPGAGTPSARVVLRAVPDAGDLMARIDALPNRARDATEIVDIFGATSFKPPPPPPPAAPKPQAPPFPYVVMGAIDDDGVRRVFLSNQEKVLVVKPADTFDGVYRVENVDARHMTLTYLPLQEQQSISLGSR